MQGIGQSDKCLPQFDELVERQSRRRGKPAGDRDRTLTQTFSGLREIDDHPTLVVRAAVSLYESETFEPLQQRRQGSGIELQPRPEVAHGDTVALPQHQHREVLRIGEAEFVEHWPIDRRGGT